MPILCQKRNLPFSNVEQGEGAAIPPQEHPDLDGQHERGWRNGNGLRGHECVGLSHLRIEKDGDMIGMRQVKAMQINVELIGNEQRVHIVSSRMTQRAKEIAQIHPRLTHDQRAEDRDRFGADSSTCPDEIFFEKAEIVKVHRVSLP